MVGLAIVGTALFFLIRDLSSVDSAYRHSAADASIKYERDAKAYQKETCISSPTVLADPDCEAKAEEAKREGQRKEQDLAAQNITAWWTKIMGIAALIGMALSAVGVWLVKTTFDETRKANDISKEVHRPWITISVKPENFIAVPFSHHFDVEFTFENVGDTAAISLGFFAEVIEENPENEGEFWSKFGDAEIDLPKSKVCVVPRDKFIYQTSTRVDEKDIRFWAEPNIINPVMIVTAFYKTDSKQSAWCKAVRAYRWIKRGGGSFEVTYGSRIDGSDFVLRPVGGHIAT